MDEVGLGKSLQRARQAAGLTQQELCQKAGLSYSTLAKIERGAIKSPSIFTIQKLVQSLGINLNSILNMEAIDNPAAKKRSKTGIKFIYFDINGVLVRSFDRAFTRISSETGISPETIESAFWHFNDAACRGEISATEFNTKFASQLRIEPFSWSEYYLSSLEPITEMQELLNWAIEHYHVGLISNIMPGLIDAMKSRKLIPDVAYTAVIDSSVVKAVKPEAKIYEIAQEKSGVQASEILLIDDSQSDIVAGERMGWRVVWFDGYEATERVKRIKEILEPEEQAAPEKSPVFEKPTPLENPFRPIG
jgi:FMN phosphatase YigB (HAD superfamily)/DNA-binding Xre family transcriptional regulator